MNLNPYVEPVDTDLVAKRDILGYVETYTLQTTGVRFNGWGTVAAIIYTTWVSTFIARALVDDQSVMNIVNDITAFSSIAAGIFTFVYITKSTATESSVKDSLHDLYAVRRRTRDIGRYADWFDVDFVHGDSPYAEKVSLYLDHLRHGGTRDDVVERRLYEYLRMEQDASDSLREERLSIERSALRAAINAEDLNALKNAYAEIDRITGGEKHQKHPMEI